MARKLKSDKFLFTATLLLVCTSVVMVYSASAVLAMERFDDPYYFLFKQATWVLIGLCLLPIVMRIDYRQYRQPVVIWTGIAVVAIALIAVLFGPSMKGATRWLAVGPMECNRRSSRKSSSSSSPLRCSSVGWTASTRCPTRCCRSALSSAASSR